MHIFTADIPTARRPLSIMSSRIQAGFPSPAEDYIEGKLDLNEHLIHRPAATFILRVTGKSMTGAGIFPDDLLIVDRSLGPQSGDVVVAVLDNEFTVKRLIEGEDGWCLKAEDKGFPTIHITEEMDLIVWGVVSSAIHQFRRR